MTNIIKRLNRRVDGMLANYCQNNHDDYVEALKYGVVNKEDKLQELINKVLAYISCSEPDNDYERVHLTYNMVSELRFKLTGVGHFSNFYEHNDYPNIGFKIGTKVEDSSSAYLAWCREHQGEAGVPLIHSVKKVNNGMFLVVLEKYNKVNKSEDGYELYKQLNRCFHDSDVTTSLRDVIYREIRYGDVTYIKQHRKFIWKYCKTIIAIAKYFKDLAQFDMHDDNWCFDNNGYPIIIDPVSFRRKILD